MFNISPGWRGLDPDILKTNQAAKAEAESSQKKAWATATTAPTDQKVSTLRNGRRILLLYKSLLTASRMPFTWPPFLLPGSDGKRPM